MSSNRPIAQRQGVFADAGGSHAEVIEALTRSRTRKLQSIGYMLKLCRELRVKADYRIEDDLTIQDAEAARSHSDRIWAAAEALDQAPAELGWSKSSSPSIRKIPSKSRRRRSATPSSF